MSVNAFITDGIGKGKKTEVTDNNELRVIQSGYPPLAVQKTNPLRQYLTSDGTSSGSNDMGVDGSVTNQDFWIAASQEKDRYITSLNFLIGYGTSGAPYQWANGAALTNGSYLFYSNIQGIQDIHDGIKNNQDLFRLSFQNITSNWEIRHVNANNDYGYFISMDISKLGLPFGIKLDKGSTQKLVLRIRDNAGLDADAFTCITYGFERFK